MIQPDTAISVPRSQRGFSLMELLVVVAIIMIIAATGLPAIARYIKNYQIRGASQQVAGEISTARSKAIMKNVNYGVTFVVLSNNTYQYVIEDSSHCTTASTTAVAGGTVACTTRQTLTDLIAAGDAGTLQTLPSTVRFGTGCVDTIQRASGSTSVTFAGNDSGFRFSRYGAHCDPTGAAEPCPDLTVGLANSVMNLTAAQGSGAMVCLTQDTNGDGAADIRRMVIVAAGGRVVQR
jgi:prepilin-type N-terminal cleavage/methylation domain-containing protein